MSRQKQLILIWKITPSLWPHLIKNLEEAVLVSSDGKLHTSEAVVAAIFRACAVESGFRMNRLQHGETALFKEEFDKVFNEEFDKVFNEEFNRHVL